MHPAKQKRGGDGGTEASSRRQRGGDGARIADTAIEEEGSLEENGLVFEDPFGDEYEEEQFDEEAYGDLEDEDEEDIDGEPGTRPVKGKSSASITDDDEQDNAPKSVWRPGVDQIPEGETLEYDPSAYVMYHSMQAEWPCLSFDFLRDGLGESRQRVRYLSYCYYCIETIKSRSSMLPVLCSALESLVPADHVRGGWIPSRQDREEQGDAPEAIRPTENPSGRRIRRGGRQR
jgi:Histone-binding protein RBBP4 or subunit C of CAF1 complex